MGRILDISLPITEGMAVYPGDPAVEVRRRGGDGARTDPELTDLRLTSHTGTHLDAPSHLIPSGVSVDAIALDRLNGPCWVARVDGGVSSVNVDTVESVPSNEGRILLRTRNSERWRRERSYFPDYVTLSVEAAKALVRRRVTLVGIDALSVDPPAPSGGGPGLPAHQILLAAGIVVLEGLQLDQVSAGPYELLCLPLSLPGADGAPARAALTPRRAR